MNEELLSQKIEKENQLTLLALEHEKEVQKQLRWYQNTQKLSK